MGKIINWLMDWAFEIASIALTILPDSPIQQIQIEMPAPLADALAWVNYFVPFGIMFTIMTSYVSAALIYYGVRLVLRWTKYIQ